MPEGPGDAERSGPIVLVACFRLLPGGRADAIAAAGAMQAATVREPGCSAYRFWTAVDDPDALGLFECWETQAALDAHLQTDHMAAFGQAMAGVVDQQAEATRYDVARRTIFSAAGDADRSGA